MADRRDLRVTAEGSFSALVRVLDGRVSAEGTAPYLRRLRGLTEEALRSMAEAKGWTVEDNKPCRSRVGVAARMHDDANNHTPEGYDHDQDVWKAG